ncbi:GlcNAc-transferase family protein [Actinoplanes sp. RD1]|uniref:GlcNAc-transferase family protein n=1 Tax=Actinoplanes sp. RD1 TaxID=3064538 RepID=UPI0027406604|nr:GlcNAc-transferase family protein [Actinoplanes sp. RD1]
MTIMVSVAAYRDPELVPTVLDCLAKAERPDELRIVVCWQHLGDEDISAIADDPRVHVLDYDARQSQGACWARAEVMRHYRGEDWFLQIDSHTRFTPGWDTRLIELAGVTGAAKPIITCYPPDYQPGAEYTGSGEPTEIIVGGWMSDGFPWLSQRALDDRSGKPVPANFVAGGFLFAPGSLVTEVPYDPYLYFQGEELTLSLRAYTWGYDLFHPTEVLAWHYYVRADSPRHWTDHLGEDGARTWHQRDKASRRRIVNLLRYPDNGRYGVGTVRTLDDYQAYTGLSFRKQTWADARAESSSDAPANAG